MMKSKHNDLRRFGLIKLGEREEGRGGRGIFGLKNVKTQFVRLRAHSSLSSYPPCFQKRRAEGYSGEILFRRLCFRTNRYLSLLLLLIKSQLFVLPPSFQRRRGVATSSLSVRPSSSSFAVIWERQIDSLLLSRRRNRSSQGSRQPCSLFRLKWTNTRRRKSRCF